MKELHAVMKVIRTRNAELFIDSLGKDFTDGQKENFIEVLVEFQEFLDKKDSEIDNI